MTDKSVEKGPESGKEINQQSITVSQPQKLEKVLETINLMESIGERIGEDKSGDMGGTGTGKTGTAAATQSWRDQAMANLPSEPMMQAQLQKHIKTEVKKLRKEVRRAACKASKAGSAHKLNELYARIRRLNGILKELYSSSVDTIKRLYVRIFVDKQTVFQ